LPGAPPQSIAMNGLALRAEWSWIAWAAVSLPVPGFALEQHADLRRRGALEQREARAHRHRRADQLPELGAARHRDAELGVADRDPQRGAAELQRAAIAHVARDHAHAVEHRAVGAIEIVDPHVTLLDAELAVGARDRGIVDHDLVTGVRADRAGGSGRRVGDAGGGAGDADHLELAHHGAQAGQLFGANGRRCDQLVVVGHHLTCIAGDTGRRAHYTDPA
jgi:hypothetical protein